MDRRDRLRQLLAKDAVVDGDDEAMASGEEEGSEDEEVMSHLSGIGSFATIAPTRSH
jgi:hypothetical protein